MEMETLTKVETDEDDPSGCGRQEFWVRDSDGVREGPHRSWFQNGNPDTESVYRAGLLEGSFRRWHLNGTLYLETTFHAGVEDGDQQTWHPNGARRSHTGYRAGRLDGVFESWHPNTKPYLRCEYKAGRVIRVTALHDETGRDTMLGDGDLTVWKACRTPTNTNVCVELRVPATARRVTPVDKWGTYSSRVESATVVSIRDDAGVPYQEADSFVYGHNKIHYVVGDAVSPDGFEPAPDVQNGAGISVHKYRDHCAVWFRPKN